MLITIDLVFALITAFSIGVSVGVVLGERKSKGVFKPMVSKYMTQKTDMWKEFKKRIKV